MLFGLSGCGQEVNYLEADPYIEYTYKKIDELNSDYLPTVKLYLEELGVPKLGGKLDEYMEKIIEKELSGMSKVEASAAYKQYKKDVDEAMDEEFKATIDFNVAQMKTILEDEEALAKRKDNVDAAKTYYSENKDKVNDYFKRLLSNYEEELNKE